MRLLVVRQLPPEIERRIPRVFTPETQAEIQEVTANPEFIASLVRLSHLNRKNDLTQDVLELESATETCSPTTDEFVLKVHGLLNWQNEIERESKDEKIQIPRSEWDEYRRVWVDLFERLHRTARLFDHRCRCERVIAK